MASPMSGARTVMSSISSLFRHVQIPPTTTTTWEGLLSGACSDRHFSSFQVFFKARNRRRTRAAPLCAWAAESFAWICTANTERSWEQTDKTRRELSSLPAFHGSAERRAGGRGGDRQCFKCSDCSSAGFTTCTESTFQLQSRQLKQSEAGMSVQKKQQHTAGNMTAANNTA